MQTVRVKLPTLHAGQVRAFKAPRREGARHWAIRCGRRWGKTEFGKTLACDAAAKGKLVGWFAPSYKYVGESYKEILDILEPIKAKGTSQGAGVIRTTTGGRVDFWTLEDERAGRSRKYHRVIIDEAAFADANRSTAKMTDIWDQSIEPTLLDYKGVAYALSNTNGVQEDQWFWRICNRPDPTKDLGFNEFHAPTHDNPLMPPDELVKLEARKPPLVFLQEYKAEFVDWSGVQFFSLDKITIPSGLLNTNGTSIRKGVPYPYPIDRVFATVDTANKTGKEHDGTAVIYWAKSSSGGYPLTVLDWDIVQIEGSMLENWLPSVFQRLEFLSRQTRARYGSSGAFIEDQGAGLVLLQKAANKGWPATPIDSKLTALGKDERAIAVSEFVYQEQVKLSDFAYDKTMLFKETEKNHLLGQVIGFRIADKDANKREDDLLDAFCYGIALGLADQNLGHAFGS